MQKKIHFVTGKGGVGKSVVAAALAFKEAKKGPSLLVELGDKSFYADYLKTSEVLYKPTSYKEVSVALWSGAECLKEYARHLIKVEALYRLFFENPVMKTLINIAPALPELAIMGKITSGPRKHGPPLNWDFLTVDSFATGHFLALMRAAPAMAAAVPFGPMGEQSRSIAAVLKNQELCEFHIVTLPEEMPLKEALELKQQLKDEFSINAKLYLNKCFDLDEKVSLPSGPFGEYLAFQRSKTVFARNYLQDRGETYQEIPWILESQGEEIIRQIEGFLK